MESRRVLFVAHVSFLALLQGICHMFLLVKMFLLNKSDFFQASLVTLVLFIKGASWVHVF